MMDDKTTPREEPGEGTPVKGLSWIYGALSEIPEIIIESLTYLQNIANENGNIQPGEYQKTITGIASTIENTLQGITRENAIFSENERAIADFTGDQTENLPEELKAIAPYLQAELKAAPEHASTPIAEVLKTGIDESGNVLDGPYKEIIARAQERARIDTALQNAVTAMQVLEETAEAIGKIEIEPTAAAEFPRIITKSTDLLTYPLDKPNNVIWNYLTNADTDGQISFEIDTSKKGSGQEAIIYYGISFDELEDVKITKSLTPFDKRVYIAVAALYNAGNDVISTTQIYKMMGNTGRPSDNQIKKINDSMTKMGAAIIHIDNSREVQVNKKYSNFKYDASLLPFERISAYINNTITESAIHLFREPPLITFARERGQVTTITRQLLESPLSKTDATIQLEDYLIERIAYMKSPKTHAPRKMLYSTIYEHCGIKTKKQMQRAPAKINQCLDHYQKCGWIAGFKIENDGITIIL